MFFIVGNEVAGGCGHREFEKNLIIWMREHRSPCEVYILMAGDPADAIEKALNLRLIPQTQALRPAGRRTSSYSLRAATDTDSVAPPNAMMRNSLFDAPLLERSAATKTLVSKTRCTYGIVYDAISVQRHGIYRSQRCRTTSGCIAVDGCRHRQTLPRRARCAARRHARDSLDQRQFSTAIRVHLLSDEIDELLASRADPQM